MRSRDPWGEERREGFGEGVDETCVRSTGGMFAGRGVGGVVCGQAGKWSVVPNGMNPGCVPDADGALVSVEGWEEEWEWE
jgi:hypothetical protein